MSVALAAQLREGTKKSHTMAENTGFVSCFLKGVVDKASYRKLVADLYFVYTAMEEEIAKLGDHPVVGPVGMQELNRREALEQDLVYYFGAGWKDQIQPSPSAAAYVERIHAVAQESPELLVGHHYTRYLGDLSGGQILKNIAQKAMNMDALKNGQSWLGSNRDADESDAMKETPPEKAVQNCFEATYNINKIVLQKYVS